MTDDTISDAAQDTPEGARPDTASPTPETPAGTPEDKHRIKHEFRDVVGKVVGIAVETGSMLSGNAGEMVSAEGAVAEADAEKFLDSIDGEG